MMKTVGITGGIGSGKSVVSRILRCNGFRVYDCDSEAKILMVNDEEIRKTLEKKIGKQTYNSDGRLNRAFLAAKIFKDDNLRKFVNKIVHQAVRRDIMAEREKTHGEFFIESAIITTGGIVPMCQQIWIITSPIQERIKRIQERDKATYEEIEKRMKSQEKELSDLSGDVVCIQNDDSHPILPKILELTGKLKQTYFSLC